MGECQECRAEIDGDELCTDCLEQLGIQRDTADRFGLAPGGEVVGPRETTDDFPPLAE